MYIQTERSWDTIWWPLEAYPASFKYGDRLVRTADTSIDLWVPINHFIAHDFVVWKCTLFEKRKTGFHYTYIHTLENFYTFLFLFFFEYSLPLILKSSFAFSFIFAVFLRLIIHFKKRASKKFQPEMSDVRAYNRLEFAPLTRYLRSSSRCQQVFQPSYRTGMRLNSQRNVTICLSESFYGDTTRDLAGESFFFRRSDRQFIVRYLTKFCFTELERNEKRTCLPNMCDKLWAGLSSQP